MSRNEKHGRLRTGPVEEQRARRSRLRGRKKGRGLSGLPHPGSVRAGRAARPRPRSAIFRRQRKPDSRSIARRRFGRRDGHGRALLFRLSSMGLADRTADLTIGIRIWQEDQNGGVRITKGLGSRRHEGSRSAKHAKAVSAAQAFVDFALRVLRLLRNFVLRTLPQRLQRLDEIALPPARIPQLQPDGAARHACRHALRLELALELDAIRRSPARPI